MLVFGILENAMNMLGIPAFVQWLLKGVVIVGIIWMDCFYQKRRRELV
jgi:ABC-type xylose transport system permease subunit